MATHHLIQQVPQETYNLAVGYPSLLLKICRRESKADEAKG